MVEKCSSCDGSGQMPVTQVQYADGAKFDIEPGLYDVPCLDCSGKGER